MAHAESEGQPNNTANDDNDGYINDYEYETQMFGFSPVTLLNGIYNCLCDMTRDALKSFTDCLSNKYSHAMSEASITEARHAVGALIDKDISVAFDKFELFVLDQVFKIPDEAILPEDLCQVNALGEEEENELERRKIDIKRKILAVKYANAVLSKKLQEHDALMPVLEKILDNINEFSKDSCSGRDLKDHLSYVGDMITEDQA